MLASNAGQSQITIGVPSHTQSAFTVSFSVVWSSSSQGSPMLASRMGQSTTMPMQSQLGSQVSLMVVASSSSQGWPGTEVPPATPSQSKGSPTHSQSLFHASFPVEAFSSSQGVPGRAGPFTTFSQSRQVELKSGSSGNLHTPQSSSMLSPKGMPAQSLGSAKPFTRITRFPPPKVEKRKSPVTGSIIAPSAPDRPVTRSRSVPIIGSPLTSTSNTTTFPIL